jgi:hypothetical protein
MPDLCRHQGSEHGVMSLRSVLCPPHLVTISISSNSGTESQAQMTCNHNHRGFERTEVCLQLHKRP